MARRKRDYKAEYQRRKELARRRGLSTPQARGHARRNEPSVSELRSRGFISRSRKEDQAREAINLMRREGISMNRAAERVGISRSAVKRYGKEHGLLEHVPYEEARRFAPSYRPAPTPSMWFIRSGGWIVEAELDARNRSIVGRYQNTVRAWRGHGNSSKLREFRRVVVTDVEGNRYVLAANPAEIDLALLRAGDQAGDYEENIYLPAA